MTKQDQKRFIEECITNVQAKLLNRLPSVPDEWSGVELRLWIIERFASDLDTKWARAKLGRKRMREYNNTVLVQNL